MKQSLYLLILTLFFSFCASAQNQGSQHGRLVKCEWEKVKYFFGASYKEEQSLVSDLSKKMYDYDLFSKITGLVKSKSMDFSVALNEYRIHLNKQKKEQNLSIEDTNEKWKSFICSYASMYFSQKNYSKSDEYQCKHDIQYWSTSITIEEKHQIESLWKELNQIAHDKAYYVKFVDLMNQKFIEQIGEGYKAEPFVDKSLEVLNKIKGLEDKFQNRCIDLVPREFIPFSLSGIFRYKLESTSNDGNKKNSSQAVTKKESDPSSYFNIDGINVRSSDRTYITISTWDTWEDMFLPDFGNLISGVWSFLDQRRDRNNLEIESKFIEYYNGVIYFSDWLPKLNHNYKDRPKRNRKELNQYYARAFLSAALVFHLALQKDPELSLKYLEKVNQDLVESDVTNFYWKGVDRNDSQRFDSVNDIQEEMKKSSDQSDIVTMNIIGSVTKFLKENPFLLSDEFKFSGADKSVDKNLYNLYLEYLKQHPQFPQNNKLPNQQFISSASGRDFIPYSISFNWEKFTALIKKEVEDYLEKNPAQLIVTPPNFSLNIDSQITCSGIKLDCSMEEKKAKENYSDQKSNGKKTISSKVEKGIIKPIKAFICRNKIHCPEM